MEGAATTHFTVAGHSLIAGALNDSFAERAMESRRIVRLKSRLREGAGSAVTAECEYCRVRGEFIGG
jgi:hypothetical protein